MFSLNTVFFAMEMRRAITGDLVMTVADEIGPVEFELFFTISAILFGIYGNDGLHKTIGESLGIPPGSACPLHAICEYEWQTPFSILLCCL